MDRFFDRFWDDLGVISDSKIDQKSMSKFDRFLDASWKGPGAPTSHLHAISWRKLENGGSLGEGRVRVEHPLPRILGSES